MVHCIYRGIAGYNFQIKVAFLFLKIFVIANSVDPYEMPHSYEMPHYAAFHLCLAKVGI